MPNATDTLKPQLKVGAVAVALAARVTIQADGQISAALSLEELDDLQTFDRELL